MANKLYGLTIGAVAASSIAIAACHITPKSSKPTLTEIAQQTRETNLSGELADLIKNNQPKLYSISNSQETSYGSLFGGNISKDRAAMSLTWYEEGKNRQIYIELTNSGNENVLKLRTQYSPSADIHATAGEGSLKGWSEGTYIVDVITGKIKRSYEGPRVFESYTPDSSLVDASTLTERKYQRQRQTLELELTRIIKSMQDYLKIDSPKK